MTRTKTSALILLSSALLTLFSLSAYAAPGKGRPDSQSAAQDGGWFNVREFGARGDGQTDDARAIQDAIEACRQAGGGTVFFPRGIYSLKSCLFDTDNFHVSSALHVYSDQTLLFEEGATLLRGDIGVNHMLFTHNEKDAGGYEGCRNILILGATVDENSALDSDDTAFNITHGQDIAITGCTFLGAQGGWHSIEINSSRSVVISGCTFRDNSNSEDIQTDSAGASGNLGRDDGTACQNVLISQCTFLSDGHVAIGNHDIGTHRDITITGCTFKGTSNPRGFISYTGTVSGVTVFRNTFLGEKGQGHTAVELKNPAPGAGRVSSNIYRGIDTRLRGGGILMD